MRCCFLQLGEFLLIKKNLQPVKRIRKSKPISAGKEDGSSGHTRSCE